jgi:hypothetical protein
MLAKKVLFSIKCFIIIIQFLIPVENNIFIY